MCILCSSMYHVAFTTPDTMMPSTLTRLAFLLHCCLWIPCSTSFSTCSSLERYADLGIDITNLQETINQGRVYQVFDFFTEQEVLDLLQDMDRLEANGSFRRSGLSNTVKGNSQNFGSQDRYTCSVPWWNLVLTTPNSQDSHLPSYARKLVQLKALVATALDRPTIINSDQVVAHECYYSKSLPCSTLKRHMDERHEEFKQAKGWLLPSRRSISWLVYLSDEPWTLIDNGGALRAFPQKRTCGKSTHEGNLQVGWWTTNDQPSKPVYLNSWFPLITEHGSPPEPHCVLYVINDDDTIHFLTNPWSSDVLLGMSTADFILLHQKELFRDEDYKTFYLIEDRAAWDAGKQPHNSDVLDVAPMRRSLVMFDSVSVPHEVMPIAQGTRRALAGWFHEETQPIPEQYVLG